MGYRRWGTDSESLEPGEAAGEAAGSLSPSADLGDTELLQEQETNFTCIKSTRFGGVVILVHLR